MKSLSNRTINILYDAKPGLHHQYILSITKPFIKNKLILDLGCWSGQYTSLATKYAKKVYGIDPNRFALNFAKKQTPKAEFKVGSALAIPYPNNTFDTVVFSEVLEHIPPNTENKAFAEIYRVLKPKGTLILTTPRNHLLSILLDPAYFLIGHRHYSKDAIINFLISNGFAIKEIFFSKGIVNLIISNIDAFAKILFDKKINYPNFINGVLKNELNKKGFSSIFAIAKRMN